MSRRGSTPCTERTKSDYVRMAPFVDWGRESTGRITHDAAAESGKNVKTAEPRRRSEKTAERMRVKRETKGEGEKCRATRLDGCAEVQNEGDWPKLFATDGLCELSRLVDEQLKK